MQHLDLFSGIGGFALAADRVWGNVEHIFCENDLFCQEVLKKHWPQAKIYGDIRTLTNTNGVRLQKQGAEQQTIRDRQSDENTRTYLLTGGFPCQPFSQAGRRKGTSDDRYLWPEMFRVIREFKPQWVIGENVAGFITWSNGMVLRQVLTDLESEGYEIQAFVIPACAVNAPHKRDRIWIIGHAKYDGLNGAKDGEGDNQGSNGNKEGKNELRQSERANSLREDVADTKHQPKGNEKRGRVQQTTSERTSGRGKGNGDWNQNWLEVATRLCRVDDGLSRRLDRNPRLKALGNAIVPQVAEEIMKGIKSLTK